VKGDAPLAVSRGSAPYGVKGQHPLQGQGEDPLAPIVKVGFNQL
ncbi:hypothetical protein Tco_1365547, partial [Tanacetum coccineum]